MNFSETFLHAALSVEQNIPIYSVVNSLLALGNADKVQILIDGEEDAVFGTDLSLYSFFEKNEELIAENKSRQCKKRSAMTRRPICLACLLLLVLLCGAHGLGFPLAGGNPMPKSLKEWAKHAPKATICGEVEYSADTQYAQSVYRKFF